MRGAALRWVGGLWEERQNGNTKMARARHTAQREILNNGSGSGCGVAGGGRWTRGAKEYKKTQTHSQARAALRACVSARPLRRLREV
jgi:hypothetical protein